MACFSARNAFANNLSFIANYSSANKRRPMFGLVSSKPLLVLSSDRRDYSCGSLVLKAVSLLGPPSRFEASKLKVVFMGEEIEKQPFFTVPRAYTLTHCDFTANLTLAVSNNITNDMLREWQTTLQRDDVVAEWKKVNDEISLHVHCYVLKAVVYGDSALFTEHPELMEAVVWVYFHSKSKKYDKVECWGPLRDASQRTFGSNNNRSDDGSQSKVFERIGKWVSPGTILQAFFTVLL